MFSLEEIKMIAQCFGLSQHAIFQRPVTSREQTKKWNEEQICNRFDEGLECSKRAENLMNRKNTLFYIEAVPQIFSQLRKKPFFCMKKKQAGGDYNHLLLEVFLELGGNFGTGRKLRSRRSRKWIIYWVKKKLWIP